MKRIHLRILFVLLFIILTVVTWLIWRYFHEDIVPRIRGFEVHGIDVSHHQKSINWNKVRRDSIDFAFIKATEGENFLDPRFKKNWREAKENHIVRGAYHFYRPSVLPDIQARHFIRMVHLSSGDFPPVLDLEVTDNRPKNIIIEGAKRWLTMIENHYGVKPIIYTNRHWYKNYIEGNIEGYPIWMAAYTLYPRPKLSNYKPWIFWQYASRGRVKGISGDVDLNVFYGSKTDFNELFRE